MKTYLSISFFINIVLAATYYNLDYFKKHFHQFEDVEKTMLLTSSLLEKQNEKVIKGRQKLLGKKPSLKKPLNVFFDCSNEIVNPLTAKIEKLIQVNTISDQAFQEIINENYAVKQKLKRLFKRTMSDKEVMKEGKLKRSDVDKEVEAANRQCYERWDFRDSILEDLSTKEKKFVLNSIMLDLQNANTSGINKIASLVGGRISNYSRHFPIIWVGKTVAKVNEPFEVQIAAGAYYSELSEDATVYWDGKKIDLEDGYHKLQQKVTSSGGYEKHEAVIVWLDKDDKIQRDTSYYEFYITP